MDAFLQKVPEILSLHYVFENGIIDNGQFFYEYEDENGITNDGQAYDKPRTENGKPITALVYTVYASGELESYNYLVNGFDVPDSAEFYKNGQVSVRDYWDTLNNERYTLEWYENGAIKSFWKSDNSGFIWQDSFDEADNIIKKGIKCGKLLFFYDFLNPDEKVNVMWHKNNKFKRIVWKEADSEQLYREVSFDENENITELIINNLYAPKYILNDGMQHFRYAEKYDDSFKMIDGLLIQKDNESNLFTGVLYDTYNDGTLKYVFNYKNGKLSGNQNRYYPNGQLAEFFDCVKGKIGIQKYVWFDSGKLKSALVYLVHKKNFYYTEFNQKGNIIAQYETDSPFVEGF